MKGHKNKGKIIESEGQGWQWDQSEWIYSYETL